MTSSTGFSRLATLAFVCVLALGTACGGSDTGGSDTGGRGGYQPTATAGPSATTAPAAPTTIPLLTAPTAPPKG